MSVMALQCCKFSPQKSRPLESGHSRHGVWIAIEYSYYLGLKFLCVHGQFLQIKSHILILELSMLATHYIYRILQIVRGGKVSRMDRLVSIRWKTFAVH